MSLPTVGRIVHFRERMFDGKEFGPVFAAVPAIITRVHSPSCVCLQVFFPDRVEPRTSVCMDESETPPNSVSWRWPPREDTPEQQQASTPAPEQTAAPQLSGQELPQREPYKTYEQTIADQAAKQQASSEQQASEDPAA